MEVNAINSTQNIQPKEANAGFGAKILKKFKDTVELNQAYQNTPRMGVNDIEAFKEQLPEDVVAEINKTRQLPADYTLRFTPKTITHHYRDGLYVGDTVQPPTYHLVKKSKWNSLMLSNSKTFDKIPDDYQVINVGKTTFIAKKDETEETISKKVKTSQNVLKAIAALSVGCVAALAGIALMKK